jgi:CrcB protein
MVLIALAVASALGAGCRYVVDVVVQSRHERTFPWGTWTVNVTGALALGALTGLAARGLVGSSLVAVAGVGFLGAYTTFSTFMVETLRLVEDGARLTAALNVVTMLLVGLAAAAGGWALMLVLGS